MANINKKSKGFEKYLLSKYKINDKGEIVITNSYARLRVEIKYKKDMISFSYSHLVYFLKHNKWPKEGMNIDHKDDNPLNNHPDNLQEVTVKDNHRKRRGKSNGRYGKTKYGYGITIQKYNKTNGYTAIRYLSVDETGYCDKNKRRKYIGYSKSLEKLDSIIKEYIDKYITSEEGLMELLE